MCVDVYKFDAKVTVLVANTREVTWVAGNEPLSVVNQIVTQLTLATSRSFVGFNRTQLPVSLEMSGAVFLFDMDFGGCPREVGDGGGRCCGAEGPRDERACLGSGKAECATALFVGNNVKVFP